MSKLKPENIGSKIWCPINNTEITIKEGNESILLANGHYNLFVNGGPKGDLSKLSKKAEISPDETTPSASMDLTFPQKELIRHAQNKFQGVKKTELVELMGKSGVKHPKKATLTELHKIAQNWCDAQAI